MVMFAGGEEVDDAVVSVLELGSERIVDVVAGGVVVVLGMELLLGGSKVILELDVVGKLEIDVLDGVSVGTVLMLMLVLVLI